MDVSNKTLAMFLVAAIVVSIAGTVISLNRFSELDGGLPTGKASFDTGNVSLTVSSSLSIILDDTLINFGECSTAPGGELIDSASISTNCTAPNGADEYIVLRNNGNVDANVSINVSDVGEAHTGTFLVSPSEDTSYIQYRTLNESGAGGCLGDVVTSYANFTNTANIYNACTNLQADAALNSIRMYARIFLPQTTATGQDDIVVTFWAQAS